MAYEHEPRVILAKVCEAVDFDAHERYYELDDAKSQVATFRVAWSKLRRLEEINGDAVEK
jgi:hypothetical protein